MLVLQAEHLHNRCNSAEDGDRFARPPKLAYSPVFFNTLRVNSSGSSWMGGNRSGHSQRGKPPRRMNIAKPGDLFTLIVLGVALAKSVKGGAYFYH